jgi:MFS transporter, ACDE family, multidrug resistance protein
MNNSTINPQQQSSNNNILRDKNFHIVNTVTLLGIMGGIILNPILPSIQQSFQVSTEQASWIATLYQLPGAIVTPIFGILADSFGRKVILIPSLLIFAGGGVLSGLATQFYQMLAGRLLQGVGAASLEPLQLAIIGDLYQGRKLGMAMEFNASLIGISGVIFPLLGGILGGFSWRYPFFLSLLAIPIGLLTVTLLRIPKSQRPKEKFSFSSYFKKTLDSINNRHVLGLLFAVFSLFLLQTLCLTYIPFLAAGRFKTSEAANAFLLTVMSIVLAVFAAQLGKLLRHLSEIKLIKLAFILFAITLAILPIIPTYWLLFIPIALLGIAQGISIPCSQALLAGLSAQESRGAFMAVNASILSWGQTLAPALGGIMARFWGIESIFYAAAIVSVISFGIFNYSLTTNVFNFAAKTLVSPNPHREEAPTYALGAEPATSVQETFGQFLHLQTNKIIEFPEDFDVITIGKPKGGNIPEVDVSNLPDSNLASRVHAQIRFDGEEYYIQDMGSANGTYINKYPVLPGIWYKLKPGLLISLGRKDKLTFVFQLG